MASTFLGLYISQSGLHAANASINTTAHNIANINTTGFSRQVVEQQAGKAVKIYQPYGMLGTGVSIMGIGQIRDSYYDQKYWKNNGNLGEYKQKNYYMSQIEELYFSEMKTSAGTEAAKGGFTSYYSKFTNALETLYTNPSEVSKRNAVIQAAQTLSSYYNDTDTSLSAYQEDSNLQIAVMVEEINALAKNIASLNKQISMLEIDGDKANDLRDQRANLVDELSNYVGITVEEKTSDTGSSSYSIRICSQTLVEGVTYNQLKVETRSEDERRHNTDNYDLYDIKWTNGMNFATYNEDLTGQIKGYLDIRDGNNQEIISFPAGKTGLDYKGIPYYKEQTNLFTKEYTRQFNMLQMQGQDLKGNSTKDVPFFSVSTMTTEEIKVQTTAIWELYKNGNAGDTATIKNADGSTTTWTKEDAVSWMKEKALIYAKEQHSTLAESDLVDADGKVLPQYLTEYEDAEYMVMVDYLADQMTAKYMCVNEDLILDNNKMATTVNTANGVDSQDLIGKMVDLAEKNFMENGTASAFMESLVSVSAIDATAALAMETNYKNISDTIVNQRLSISGVDKDEEAVNLVKYQNAYELSAKCITIMTELYDKLINETAV